jgi:Tfp pilus assembly protein PilX
MNSAHYMAGGRQRGLSLITAVFLLVGLGLLGATMTRMMVTQSQQTIDTWYSSQALYAAESGVQYAAYALNRTSPAACSLTVTDSAVTAESWFSIATQPVTLGTLNVCEITATGKAGISAANPAVQRQIVVTYRWAGL